ncbi:hypothetical protein ABMA27_013348 [Loxostege sticticalis]|uniref:Defensin n=1 Tax=Loxostege sticticalis TaxID=481309 RepID=A0ABR3IEX3_LOXSC
MEFRVCVILPIFLVCLVHISTSLPTPKDSTLVKSDELIINNEPIVQKVQDNPPAEAANPNVMTIPGRVHCLNGGEEPVEDEDCQRHCIPKGYTYGLCFNNVCSCA